MSWVSKAFGGVTSGLTGMFGMPSPSQLWGDFTGKNAIDLQNQYNMQMWNMQNEYNTPANQMARYRAAGLNPNLIYGNGASSAGNAAKAPEMQAHSGSVQKLIGLAQTLLGMRGELQGQELNKAQTLNAIEHSKEALDFERQRFIVDQAFKDYELKLREREFGARSRWQDRDYELAKEKWEYEKQHIDTYGTKPGTWYDFLGRALGNVAGVPNGAMGISAYAGKVLDAVIGTPFHMLGNMVGFASRLNRYGSDAFYRDYSRRFLNNK